MFYSTRHICMLFDISEATCRNWAKEFDPYLSAKANPGSGRHRNFNQEDLGVFALVHEMKQHGMTYEDIHIALKSGQRATPPVLPNDELDELITTEQQRQIAVQLQRLQLAVSQLESERDELAAKIRPLEDENLKMKATLELAQSNTDKRITELSEQLNEARKRIEDLNREVGESYVRGVMETLERKGDLKS